VGSGDFTAEMDPNTANQEWAEFIFTVRGGRYVPPETVQDNFRNWCKAGFGEVGRVSVDLKFVKSLVTYELTVQVELQGGNSAADEFYCSSISNNFKMKFMEPGFGPLAFLDFDSRVLAGEDVGKPRAQLIAMPIIEDDWLRKNFSKSKTKVVGR
jgi:hypothetical protein